MNNAATQGTPLSTGATPRHSGLGGNPFRAILDVAAAIASSLDVETVLANVAASIGAAMMVQEVEVAIYDQQAQTLTQRTHWSAEASGAGVVDSRPVLLLDRPALAAAVRGGEPVEQRLSDVALSQADRDALAVAGVKARLSSALSVGGRVLGVLSLVERRFERHFTSIENDIFRQLCGIAAVAIHNADLYEAAERQRRRLASMVEAGRAVSSSLVLDEVLTAVAEHTTRALGVTAADVYEYDAAHETMTWRATWPPDQEFNDDDDVPGTIWPLDEYPGDPRPIRDGLVLVERISDPDIHPNSRRAMERWGEKVALAVPLRFGDLVLGTLELSEDRDERVFGDEEIELATAQAVQAAIAIHNAIMYRRQGEQMRRLASLLETSRAVTSSLVLDDVLAAVAEHSAKALGTPGADIYAYDAANDTITWRATWPPVDGLDIDKEVLGDSWPLDEYPGPARSMREGVVVMQTISDPNLDPNMRRALELWGQKTALIVPLCFDDTILGTLELAEGREERVFSEEDTELATALAEHAAVAIHNATTYRQQSEQMLRLTTLLDINRTLASYTDEEVFAAIARRCAAAFDAPRALIYEYDATHVTLTPRGCYQLKEVPGYDTTGIAEPLDKSPAYRAILMGTEPVVEQVDDPSLDPEGRAEMELWGETTCLNVPIAFRGERLGILMLAWTEAARRFNDQELDFAMGLGELAAIAVRNARLASTQGAS